MLNKAAPIKAGSAPIVATTTPLVSVDGHIYLGDTSTPAAGVTVLFCEVDSHDTLGGQCYNGVTNSSGEIAVDASDPNTRLYLPENIDWSMHVENLAYPQYQLDYFPAPTEGTVCAQSAIDGCVFSTVSTAVTGLDAVLPLASTITGTVTADGGAALSGITVYLDQNVSGSPVEYEQVTTGDDGTYSFGGIVNGDYAIEFVDPTDTYSYQEYNDESEFYEPDLVTVAAGDNLTGVDAQLHLNGAISGTIASPGATALDLDEGALQAEIQVYDASSSSWVNTGLYTIAAANGTYLLDDLAPDTYRVRIDYVGSVNYATYVGPPVIVVAGHSTTYNATVNVTGAFSTDSSIDSITGSAAGVSIAGWAVYPANDSTSVGVALNIGSNWYGFTANTVNLEAVNEEAVTGIDVSSTHGFSGTTLVAPGTYNACIWVTEPTGPAVKIGCQTVTVAAPRKAVAHLDSVGTWADANPPIIQVKGYAVWPDSPGTTVPLAVQVNNLWYPFSASDTNPEGEAAVPGSGNQHGFDDSLSMGYKVGATYQVCVWVSEQAGGATNIGCQSLTIPVPGATKAKTDSVTGSAAGVTVSGYALYPDNDAASVGVAVNIGAGWYGLTADQHSEEGASDVPGASVNHGFVGTIPLAPGTYSACVWVTEPSGPAVNTGCHTVTVPAPTRTSFQLDSIAGVAGGISLAGFALFPDTPATSVGIAVNIGSGWYGLTANQPNSDSGAGTNHGFTGTVALAPGTYNACVWTTEPSGPAVNTGCHSVVVPQRPRTVASFDAPTGSAAGISVSGYAVFPDAFGTAVGVAINIGSGWYGLTANQANANVGTAVPGADADHGFSGTIPMAPGTYNACLWVTEPTGGAVNNHCYTVVVPVAPRTVEHTDSVTGGVGSFSVAGWAVYPGSLSATVGVALNIGSEWIGLTANEPSDEAQIAYPASTTDHGFSGITSATPGTYNVCVWVMEPSGPAVNAGCQSVTVTAPPPAVAVFETATAVSGGVQVTGYSVFPGDLPSNVGVAANVGSKWYGFTSNVPDAGEGTAYPSNPNHGFSGFVPTGHGSQTVCMYTVEPSGPAVNFGCKTVVVP
jgi:hypothetical protein